MKQRINCVFIMLQIRRKDTFEVTSNKQKKLPVSWQLFVAYFGALPDLCGYQIAKDKQSFA